MLRTITARQFDEWRAYADLEPFDEERADARAASVVREIRNTRQGRPKGSQAATLDECILKFGKPAAVPQPTTQAEAAKQAAAIRRNMDGRLAKQQRKG